MESRNFERKKSKAQAMVEFAIALPILLLLLYGILEAGRLLFIYSSIVTASRQAVRYGTATGLGDNGVPRYQDCAGMRAAAQRADFLNAFDDDDIRIFRDRGPNPSPPPAGLNETEYCFGAVDTSFNPSTSNTNRITIKIEGDFNPIVPRIVPFIARTKANGRPIEGISSRTILVSVAIVVTVPPATWQASTPTNSPTSTETPTNTPTNTPTFTQTSTPTRTSTPTLLSGTPPTATNTGTPTNTPTITLTPTVTNTPTPSFTPTMTATPIANCNLVTHGPLTISGNTMSMTINNPTGVDLLVQNVQVYWNHDRGHQTGSDKTLRLQQASLGGTFWTGNLYAPSFTITPFNLLVPTGSSTITFTFHQSYDNTDGSERILINLATNGCQNYPIDSSRP